MEAYMEIIRQSSQAARFDYWLHHTTAWESSGVSQREYCRRHSLALSTFGYWKRKLRQSNEGPPRFYPLTIPAVVAVEDNPGDRGLHLLVNKDRFRIQIEEDFSSALLKKLVLALEEMR